MLKRRGDFLAVEDLSHAVPFGFKFSQAILHSLPLMRWSGFNLCFQLFHLLLKAIQFFCNHTNGHLFLEKYIHSQPEKDHSENLLEIGGRDMLYKACSNLGTYDPPDTE